MFRIARLIPAVLSSIALVAGATVTLAASSAPIPAIRGEGAASAVPDRYIVKLRDTASLRAQGIDTRARALNDAHGGTIDQVWQHALHGFSTTMTKDEARQLAAEPDVEYVLQDQLLASAVPLPAQPSPGLTQSPVDWGLDRIDQHALPLDNKYSYDDTAGQGVEVYILSTGIMAAHPDLAGRVAAGPNFVPDGGSSTSDCHGLGTTLAGIVGGTQLGVAKKATMVSVRIANCLPHAAIELSGLVGGFDWVIDNAAVPGVILFSVVDYCSEPQTGNPAPCGPGVAETQVALQNAVFNAGLTVIGMAGDSGQDTCDIEVGSAPNTIYVGATTSADARAGTSNFGPCVTMYAPGEGITVATPGGADVKSGTTLSAAFVAGTAALFAGKPEFVGATPTQIRDELVQHRSTVDKISGLSGDSSNLLLFTGPPGLFTIGDGTSLSLRSDGRLQVFGVNKAGFMFNRTQSSAGSGSWSNWTQSATGNWLSVGSKQGPDGRITLLGVSKSGELAVRQESAASSNTWFNWVVLGGVPSGHPIARAVVANNLSNRLQVFVTDVNGNAYYRSQLTPGSKLWSTWTFFSWPGRDITAVSHSDGRIEVLWLDDAGQVWRRGQTSPTDTNWSPVTKLSGFGMVSIHSVRAANGKIALVGLDSGGGAWYRAQSNVGVWGNWIALSQRTLSQITAETNADGRIQIVGVDNLGRIWQSTQTTPNANTYTSWSQVDGQLRP